MSFGAACAVLGLWLLPHGCDKGPDAARAIDVAALPADQVVGMVLRECHGTMAGLERCAAKVTLPDGEVLQVFAHLPDRLRVQFADGAVHFLVDDHADRWIAGTMQRTDLDGEAAARLRALRDLIDVATLGPLHRAIGCQRTGPRTFDLAQPRQLPWQLTLAHDTLLVDAMTGPHGTVQVTDHLRTSTTWVVRKAIVAPLGECQIRFDSRDVLWDESMFAPPPPPTAVDDARRGNGRTIQIGAPSMPSTPTLEPMRAVRWLVVDDPVDWTHRAETVQQCLRTLTGQGQTLAGFQGLLRDGDRMRLVIPFRAERTDAKATLPADWDIRDLPAGRALVVFPPRSDLPTAFADGERLLLRALADQRLEAIGPILAQPYLHLDEQAPTADEVRAPVVRVSVAVR